MRSLRSTGRCRVNVRARPTYRIQDSPERHQPVLMESDLARARTHTLTSSPSGVVDRQRPTSILAAGSVEDQSRYSDAGDDRSNVDVECHSHE